jgi:hypothetical protein
MSVTDEVLNGGILTNELQFLNVLNQFVTNEVSNRGTLVS